MYPRIRASIGPKPPTLPRTPQNKIKIVLKYSWEDVLRKQAAIAEVCAAVRRDYLPLDLVRPRLDKQAL